MGTSLFYFYLYSHNIKNNTQLCIDSRKLEFLSKVKRIVKQAKLQVFKYSYINNLIDAIRIFSRVRCIDSVKRNLTLDFALKTSLTMLIYNFK